MRAVKRMQNPGIWHELAGWASAAFKLVGKQGEDLIRLAWEGDYIRIDVPGAAHFFRDDATSTFIIDRNDTTVTAFYHGRNEVLNTVTPILADNVRNALVAAGAIVRLSEAQWSALSKGFLAEEIGGKPGLSVALPLLFGLT